MKMMRVLQDKAPLLVPINRSSLSTISDLKFADFFVTQRSVPDVINELCQLAKSSYGLMAVLVSKVACNLSTQFYQNRFRQILEIS